MEHVQPHSQPHSQPHPQPSLQKDAAARAAAREYLFDMIRQMARLARQTGDRYVAIHLEAIIAAQRAVADDRPR